MTVEHLMRDCSLWKEKRKVMWQEIKVAGSVATERSPEMARSREQGTTCGKRRGHRL